MNDRRVFPLTTSRIVPPPTRDQQIRAEAYEEAILIARLYEERGANASAVRLALEARANVPLEEEREPADHDGAARGGQTPSRFSSSGAQDDLPPRDNADGNAPLDSSEERDLWLIARGFDMAFRALGVPEPSSLKAFPKLRRVK